MAQNTASYFSHIYKLYNFHNNNFQLLQQQLHNCLVSTTFLFGVLPTFVKKKNIIINEFKMPPKKIYQCEDNLFCILSPQNAPRHYPNSQLYPLHSLHCAVGLVFCFPAFNGHGVCTGGTIQLYCRHSELLTGISAVGFISIPVK